ncbi:MAG: DUF362 domain-containing protein [Bryobacterales bacterium]|nr:DUF362 domain-containing protein [Bryobacterales bacterium]
MNRRVFVEMGVLAVGAGALRAAESEPEAPNRPVGAGRGIHPGRVVWARDPEAARWEGPGQGHWWESSYTNQSAVDGMMSRAVRQLSGKSRDAQAWEALFRSFNRSRGRGDGGYRRGEKIVIKTNFVTCILSERSVDQKTYDLGGRRVDYMNTSPQMILALLRQLVKSAGVDPRDIAVGDPLALFPNQYYDPLHREFPAVQYMDLNGGNADHPRAPVKLSSTPLYWSSRPEEKSQDYVPVHYAEAAYLINLANLKSHTMAGVTLCAKNHFGSLIRTPPAKGYYDMHASLAQRDPGYGRYRDLVDLMGHASVGGKTLAYFIDGLYPGKHPIESVPRKFASAPFHGTWAASLLASQDPVAIDSVGLDFLRAEWSDHPHLDGADDYLHEAALAGNPPSGTFYDPDHAENRTRLTSLGVHEHWNNAEEKKYSRNLGKKEGIELVRA